MEIFIREWLSYILLGLVVGEIITLLIVFWLGFKLRELGVKSKVFFQGKNGQDLERVLMKNAEDIKDLDKEIQELYNISNKIYTLSQKSVHKVNVERFNPFKDIGGDQSFSVALLNGKNSGVVISSLHTREGTRVYAKPISGGESLRYPLTDEERKSIKEAIKEKNA